MSRRRPNGESLPLTRFVKSLHVLHGERNSEGKQLGVLAGHAGRLTHAAFSADGSHIVTTSEDGTARLFPTHNSSTSRAGIPAPALLRFEHGYMPNGMYNSSVRSILEDSNGNYWFGSWMEGVFRFDGESLTYFTEEDGLGNNLVGGIILDCALDVQARGRYVA